MQKKSPKPNNIANIQTKVIKIYIAHLFKPSYHTIKFGRVCLNIFSFCFSHLKNKGMQIGSHGTLH